MTPYEALYGRPCRSPICLAKARDKVIFSPDFVQEATKKISIIRDRIRKVSPMKGMVRFSKNGKLSPRFVRPFEILEKVGDLAYRLASPPIISSVHNVFHVSMMKKYIKNEAHVIDYGTIEMNADTTFVVEPIHILDRSKQLRRKEVYLVKVLWSHHDEDDASWELESIRAKYPQLFDD
ncbi:uncharacterized protein LOC112199083 [Rosa chinensis]|uniref:uncharacterized protein LOC112199083 n=1 Tax=Rosa chinensis TaxID=74649 RepID=UPI000D08B9F0|nr:uncharacterized protein LOC112199083 [Rosa chinensis]